MAYFDFVLGRAIYEENLPTDVNMAQIASWQAGADLQAQPANAAGAIAGARTSATRFTRTSGTWTAHELIGKYIWSFATGSPAAGKFLKVDDNTATYINIVAGYGAGALEATGTSIIILDAATERDAMKELQARSVWVRSA